jgi:hypothetical protein
MEVSLTITIQYAEAYNPKFAITSFTTNILIMCNSHTVKQLQFKTTQN